MDENNVKQKHIAAIICWNENGRDKELLNEVSECFDAKLFVKNGLLEKHSPFDGSEDVIEMPEEIDTQAKAKNYVIRWHKERGFQKVHLLEDTIQILKDPSQFANDVEKLMDLLDINSYLGTVTDVCNRVYSKYNPRLKIRVDKPEWQKLGFDELLFCSHSNTQWMVFNVSKGDEDELTFNEQFEIEMFWIIEYLARRRNTHPESLYFMNQYVTCKSEQGVYKNVTANSSDAAADPQKMQKEDALFKSMHVDYHPDNSIDIVLERTLAKLNEKVSKE